MSTSQVDPGFEALRGAKAIAEFLYGDAREHKKVYHLAERGEIPVFRLGAIICARKASILSWIEAQEAKAIKPKMISPAGQKHRRR